MGKKIKSHIENEDRDHLIRSMADDMIKAFNSTIVKDAHIKDTCPECIGYCAACACCVTAAQTLLWGMISVGVMRDDACLYRATNELVDDLVVVLNGFIDKYSKAKS